MKIALVVIVILVLVGLMVGGSVVGTRNKLVTERNQIEVSVAPGGRGAAAPRGSDSEPGGDREGLRQARTRQPSKRWPTHARLWGAPERRQERSRPTTSSMARSPGCWWWWRTIRNLKADQKFLRLQDELAGSENRIAVERRKYNESVAALQHRHRAVPEEHRGVDVRVHQEQRLLHHRAGRARSPQSEILSSRSGFKKLLAWNHG